MSDLALLATRNAEMATDSARQSPANGPSRNTSPMRAREFSSKPILFKRARGLRMPTESRIRGRDAARLGHASERVRAMVVRSSPPRSFTSISSSQLKMPCSFTKRGSMVNTSPGAMIVAS